MHGRRDPDGGPWPWKVVVDSTVTRPVRTRFTGAVSSAWPKETPTSGLPPVTPSSARTVSA
ncbi:hypothetical protein [Streptomyces daghestanicus]|uniref:Uncharacterized protein n=1 Tax=Streptomyces griseoviridis TaxID=45398 RepID=A0ABT9LFK2_STRGD|nr:hypothetical protein [Streptomyces daghestanicus]MDP9682499.1 hypothetical protein [Streptomyces griseoviridis]